MSDFIVKQKGADIHVKNNVRIDDITINILLITLKSLTINNFLFDVYNLILIL